MAKLNDVAVLDIGSKKISVMIGNKTPKGVFNVKGFGSCYYSGFSGGKCRRLYPAAAASRASPPQNRMV